MLKSAKIARGMLAPEEAKERFQEDRFYRAQLLNDIAETAKRNFQSSNVIKDHLGYVEVKPIPKDSFGKLWFHFTSWSSKTEPRAARGFGEDREFTVDMTLDAKGIPKCSLDDTKNLEPDQMAAITKALKPVRISIARNVGDPEFWSILFYDNFIKALTLSRAFPSGDALYKRQYRRASDIDALLTRIAGDIPADVERYVKEHKEQGNDVGKSYALAWSRYCGLKNPDSPHCKKDEYFEGRKSKTAIRDLCAAYWKI